MGNKIQTKGAELRKYVYFIFTLYLLSVIFRIMPKVIPFQETGANLLRYFAFIFVVLHGLKTLGRLKTVIFFSITLLFGFFSEYLGVNYGFIYGKYIYFGYTDMIYGVPWQTPLSWSVIIYICYSTTNLLFKKFGERISNLRNTFWSSNFLIILLSSLDGIAAMNIDMILDPVNVNLIPPSWRWAQHGPYFGIPIANFIGWFLVTFLATLIFRKYEGQKINSKIQTLDLLDYLPTIVYSTYLLMYGLASYCSHHLEWALIGSATMMPFILIAFIIFLLDLGNTWGG